jgi:hypothetical protein
MATSHGPGGLSEQHDSPHPTVSQSHMFYCIDLMLLNPEQSLQELVTSECVADLCLSLSLVRHCHFPSFCGPFGGTNLRSEGVFWVPLHIFPGSNISHVTTCIKQYCSIAAVSSI